ncbi:hypothetical protein WN55_02704 [Dufourea novaeangliae]|uniref:Uncharacterized protein n=1 Tax=Dufourea novaeangliae TaxID=178035 RepID=A0A154NXK7_DUFNO|nr:hypothetical protein WN55_02704 [Dufourea novaeangliae]
MSRFVGSRHFEIDNEISEVASLRGRSRKVVLDSLKSRFFEHDESTTLVLIVVGLGGPEGWVGTW